MVSSAFWAQKGTYPPRLGNEIQIFIDGQVAYCELLLPCMLDNFYQLCKITNSY